MTEKWVLEESERLSPPQSKDGERCLGVEGEEEKEEEGREGLMDG